MEIKNLIEKIILEETKQSSPPIPYRTPIIGYADAKDPLYKELPELVGNELMSPTDILPEAQTVVVYFIPFAEEMAKKVRESSTVPIVWEWCDYYNETNALLVRINQRLKRELEKEGIKIAIQPPTMNYDDKNLSAVWGHKSSAVIAGIGTFGLNHLLITKLGTMGRLNSCVISEKLEPTKRPKTSYCLYYKNGSCKYCVTNCPSGALTTEGIDKFRCDAYLNGKNIRDSQQGCPVCSSGPCAFKGFV